MNCLEPTLSACTRNARSWSSSSLHSLSLYSCFCLRLAADGIVKKVFLFFVVKFFYAAGPIESKF